MLLEVEHGTRMYCVTQSAPYYEQLLAAWRLRRAGELSGRSSDFINRAEKTLLRVFCVAKLQTRLNVWTTCEYGPMFRLLTTTCVKFDPCERGRASNLLVVFFATPGAASGAGRPVAARGGAEPYNVGLTAGQYFAFDTLTAQSTVSKYIYLFDK